MTANKKVKPDSSIHGIVFMLLALPSVMSAQIAVSNQQYSIVERGPFYRVLQRSVSITNSTGVVSQRVESYTDLGDGMHYLSNGQWVEAQDLIEITATGAQATHGQMTGSFSSDITSAGAITLSTASETFQSHPIGLFYSDSASGKVAQLGSVQPCIGTLYPPNVIVFSNMLSGIRADLMLVWAKNGFEQNLVLKQNPPPPGSFSMSSSTTTLQLWTVMDSCPVPQEQRPVLLPSGLEDHVLIFGSTWFPVGAAFAFGKTPLPPVGQAAQVTLIRPSDPGTVPVAKSLVNIAGKQVLIEEVKYIDLVATLNQLPTASVTPSANRAFEVAERGRFLTQPAKMSSAKRPIQVASTQYKPAGLVLDYNVSGSANSYTFTNGTTYHIQNSFSVGPGTATFQQNTCIKLDTNAYLLAYGNVACGGSPIVLTSTDDNCYGTSLPSSTAKPGYAAAEGIWMYYQTFPTTLQYLLVRWAQTGIRYDGSSSQPNLYNSILQDSTTGVYMNIGTNTLYLASDTYCNVATPVASATDGPPNTSGSVALNCGDTQLSFANSDLQHESTITINPSDPSKVAIFAADYGADLAPGLLMATSTNGGITWSYPALIATGNSSDGLPGAKEDVQAAYDTVGDLFVCYTTTNNGTIALARSRDNGSTWNWTTQFSSPSGFLDRPVLATGPGGTNAVSSVWVLYVEGNSGGHLTLTGAPVSSSGTIGSFISYTPGCSTVASPNYPPVGTGLAVGPNGEVIMAYESRYEPNFSSRLIYINVDTDGLGTNNPTTSCTTNIQVNMEYRHFIPAQPNRKIFRVPVLAWDRCSSSAHSNRVYLAYTDMPTTNSGNDTDVYIMHSDNPAGGSWSQRERVNNDTTTTSQFFAGISVDQTTGLIAVSWYDCRNDPINNANTQFFAAVSRDGFQTAQPANFQLTTTSSYCSPPLTPCGGSVGCWSDIVDYGDYTGLAFFGGYFFPTWCSYASVTDCCGDVHTCKVSW